VERPLSERHAALIRYGIDDHDTGILRNPETFEYLNEILAVAALPSSMPHLRRRKSNRAASPGAS
jgi:hypothetical protein